MAFPLGVGFIFHLTELWSHLYRSFGVSINHNAVCVILYDSAASLSQVRPVAVRCFLPFLRDILCTRNILNGVQMIQYFNQQTLRTNVFKKKDYHTKTPVGLDLLSKLQCF